MEKPILLTKRELIKPIEQTLERIEAIRIRKMENEDELILEGLFVLSVASFEHSLIETLKILLKRIPDKLSANTPKISKDILIDGDPLIFAIESNINTISYKNLKEVIDFFCETSGIPLGTIKDSDFMELQEIKASRNLLMHNNLIVNSIYKETAGEKVRTGGHQKRLKIDQDYLFESLMTLKLILNDLQRALENKYREYTKIRAVKNLFDYIFDTPLLKFENEFHLFPGRDEIGGMKFEQRKYDQLASSEQYFYSIWANHVSSRSLDIVPGAILHLDSGNRTKLKFLIDSIELFKS